jgi:DNA-binding MarR family transcriptional regulator
MGEDRQDQLFEIGDLAFAFTQQLRPFLDEVFAACTPLETTVLRVLFREPGKSARAAAAAAKLPPSNFSRALRGLEEKGFLLREPDPHDARAVRLFPSKQARAYRDRFRDAYAGALDDLVPDPAALPVVIDTLRALEQCLAAWQVDRAAGKSAPT